MLICATWAVTVVTEGTGTAEAVVTVRGGGTGEEDDVEVVGAALLSASGGGSVKGTPRFWERKRSVFKVLVICTVYWDYFE